MANPQNDVQEITDDQEAKHRKTVGAQTICIVNFDLFCATAQWQPMGPYGLLVQLPSFVGHSVYVGGTVKLDQIRRETAGCSIGGWLAKLHRQKAAGSPSCWQDLA